MRTTIGVAKTMGVPVKGQIIAVMVMFQESSLRNLANDGTSTQTVLAGARQGLLAQRHPAFAEISA